VATQLDVFLAQLEQSAGGDADLLADDVDAAYRFRDRMLDLQPSVHLDEEELPVLEKELERSGTAIT